MILFLIVLSITILFLLGVRKGMKKIRALEKYEFENRTDGGVVTFPNYEASVAHNKKKYMARVIMGYSTAGACLFGFFTIAIITHYLSF